MFAMEWALARIAIVDWPCLSNSRNLRDARNGVLCGSSGTSMTGDCGEDPMRRLAAKAAILGLSNDFRET